ncbi:MAG: hypothetical protein KDB27_17630 [Planctomycetales bacterium]|nr:hypothetical protein [Planctomycetales bacterium]
MHRTIHRATLAIVWLATCCGLCVAQPDLPFRKIKGKHLTLVTDVASSPGIDELVDVFDAAVPQWCEYFGVAVDSVKDWHQTGYLIVSKERFAQAGLLPDDLPRFLNGYQRGKELWLYAQPSEYYTRHLLIHEGTHAFVFNHLGTFGAPWYNEGIAEHFGTHRWKNGKLETRVMPDSKSEFPFWGRISILQRDRTAGGEQPIDNVLRFPSDTFSNNRAYAWSWGLVAMLDNHPLFQQRFRSLSKHLRTDQATFTRAFRSMFKQDMLQVHDAWDLFVANVEYGYDVTLDTVTYASPKKMSPGNNRAKVDVSKGWQSSGLQVQAGKKYRIASRGRFVVRKDGDEVWWSEPGGVTIEYWNGQPLGILQAAIRPVTVRSVKVSVAEESTEASKSGFAAPIAIGLRSELTAPSTGILFFRINEMPGRLGDNHGDVTISVKPLPN